jgi:hypothetical protein
MKATLQPRNAGPRPAAERAMPSVDAHQQTIRRRPLVAHERKEREFSADNIVHGIVGMVELETPALARGIARCFADNLETIRLAAIVEFRSGDEYSPQWFHTRAGELAEALLICVQARDMEDEGLEWWREELFHVPGVFGEIYLSPESFLWQAAEKFLWAGQAIAAKAMEVLPPRESFELIECLVFLEIIGDEWVGMNTDLGSSPTALQIAGGKARVACLAALEGGV